MQPDRKGPPIIHTFESDIKSELSRRGDSLMDVAAVQSVKVESDSNSKKWIIITSIIMFITGAGLAAYFYIKSQEVVPVPVIVEPVKVYQTSEYMPVFGDMLLPYSRLSATSTNYIILRINVNSFEGAYQATIKNENVLIGDAINYFKIGTSTAEDFSSFRDVNVKNYDLRISDAVAGQIIYGFANSDYLIISATIDDWFLGARSVITIK